MKIFRKLHCLLLSITPLHAVDFSNSTGDLLYDDGAGSTLPYRLFLPQGYDPAVTYPIVLFYHGAGERGTDNISSTARWVENLYKATQGDFGDQFKALFLVPHCPPTQRWVELAWAAVAYTDAIEPPSGQAMTASLAILDQVIATYPVDPNRIYVSGLSMGGIGTWDAIRHRPKRFAAGMPLSGGGNKDQGTALSTIPIWAYHGADDLVVPTRGTDEMQDAIVAAGGSIEYSRPAGIAHSGWPTFYNNTTYLTSTGQSTYTWLFAQQNNDPSTLVTSSSTTASDGTATATLCVSLRDSFNAPLVGKNVTLTSSRADQISAPSSPSNSEGLVTFTVTSTTPGLSVFTASNTTDSLTLAQTAAVTFVEPVDMTNDFDTWATAFPGFTDTLPASDPDGDGFNNFYEYAFGLDPTSPSSTRAITTQLDASGSLTYQRRDPALTSLTFTIWVSSDLENWHPSLDSTSTTGATGPDQSQSVTVTLSNLPDDNFFYRISAQ